MYKIKNLTAFDVFVAGIFTDIYFFSFREMCVRFADLERKLGEIDRARAVYMHASQMADPRVCSYFVPLLT